MMVWMCEILDVHSSRGNLIIIIIDESKNVGGKRVLNLVDVLINIIYETMEKKENTKNKKYPKIILEIAMLVQCELCGTYIDNGLWSFCISVGLKLSKNVGPELNVSNVL